MRHVAQPQSRPTSVCVEHATFGKIVVPSRLVVPDWSPLGITRRSAGLSGVAAHALAPDKILGVAAIGPETISTAFSAQGALVGRCVRLPGGSIRPDLEAFALMRFRYRPEGGEGTLSRIHLQARSLFFDRYIWAAKASLLLPAHADALRADPDVAEDLRDLRLLDSPLQLSAVGSDCASTNSKSSRDRILNWLASSNATDVLEFGDESVAGEREFLQAIAAAYRAAPLELGKIQDFGFAAGYEVAAPGRWIRYLPDRNCLLLESKRGLSLDRAMSEFLDWQRLLVSAALSSRGHNAALLFEKTRSLNVLLEDTDRSARTLIEAALPDRERALFRLFSVAAGWSKETGLTQDERVFASDAQALIERFSAQEVWRPARVGARKLQAA
jgi:hypothetical protein